MGEDSNLKAVGKGCALGGNLNEIKPFGRPQLCSWLGVQLGGNFAQLAGGRAHPLDLKKKVQELGRSGSSFERDGEFQEIYWATLDCPEADFQKEVTGEYRNCLIRQAKHRPARRFGSLYSLEEISGEGSVK
jgi:hypothetical protein